MVELVQGESWEACKVEHFLTMYFELDLEKLFDLVSPRLIWHALRKRLVIKEFVR